MFNNLSNIIYCIYLFIHLIGYFVFIRGYRVQYSSALGPYEGGLSFSEDVNLSTMKVTVYVLIPLQLL